MISKIISKRTGEANWLTFIITIIVETPVETMNVVNFLEEHSEYDTNWEVFRHESKIYGINYINNDYVRNDNNICFRITLFQNIPMYQPDKVFKYIQNYFYDNLGIFNKLTYKDTKIL